MQTAVVCARTPVQLCVHEEQTWHVVHGLAATLRYGAALRGHGRAESDVSDFLDDSAGTCIASSI